MSILGVILAGGQSTRMGGGDKSLLTLGDRPLLQHVIDRLTPQVDAMILNANGDPTRFATFNLPTVADSIEGFAGPLAGVLAGMDYAAKHGHSHIVTVAADTPFFPDDLTQALSTNAAQINISKTPSDSDYPNLHPTFGLWDVTLRDVLRSALNDDMRKVMGFVKQHNWRPVEWDTGTYDPFFNVNTAEDMKTADHIIKGLTP